MKKCDGPNFVRKTLAINTQYHPENSIHAKVFFVEMLLRFNHFDDGSTIFQ